jgi:hypothetical protein
MPNARKTSSRKGMSQEHKAALAKGRAEGLAVRRYLEALESSRPRRGRRRTPASIDRRLKTIDGQLANADPMTRLHLLQEQKDLLEELARTEEAQDISELEKRFVRVARSYGQRKGISYGTWRAAGVSAVVLERAGVTRARA